MHDPVIYYTHLAGSGDGPKTADSLAFVLRENENGSKDLVVFPPGGPTQYVNAREYDPEVDIAPGGSYIREIGSEPPDFGDDAVAAPYAGSVEWSAMIQRHAGERQAITRAEDMESTRKRQQEERDILSQRLDAKAAARGPKDQPVEEEPVDEPQG